jgi:hypothetical protein
LALLASTAYVDAVHARTFPSVNRGEVYEMEQKEWEGFLRRVERGSTD